MSMMNLVLEISAYVLLGLFSGTISGVVGIGGGVIILPALTFLFGFSQHHAQGTTLALLVPPIGLLAAYNYYINGFVDLKAAAFICAGFLLGGLAGSKMAIGLSDEVLQKIFGGSMIIIGLYMIFKK